MSLPDEAMKLKDGKIIYDQLASMVAVQYSEAESNPAGSYVIYNGSVYLLPNGHIANTSWANTEKEGPTNIGAEHRALKTEITNSEIIEKLKADDIPGTTQTITFDQQTGEISQITHTANNTAVRTDVLTFGEGTITEVRTLSTGQSLTIVTNTTTLVTTITYADVA